MNVSGIYKIQSKIKPERIYIGSSINIKTRWDTHINELKKNKHRSKKLQYHFNKYGIGDLEFTIIEFCDIDKLILREQYYLDTCILYFNTYKVAGSPLGKKHSLETRKKISQSNIGKIISNEVREKIRKANKGRHYSKDTEFKIGQESKMKGHHHSKESKIKLSESRKGKTPWNKGKRGVQVVTDETRIKLSQSRLGEKNGMFGKHHSEESNRKNSEAHIGGIPWNKGIKTGVAPANKGKGASEEIKQKLRASWVKRKLKVA